MNRFDKNSIMQMRADHHLRLLFCCGVLLGFGMFNWGLGCCCGWLGAC